MSNLQKKLMKKGKVVINSVTLSSNIYIDLKNKHNMFKNVIKLQKNY